MPAANVIRAVLYCMRIGFSSTLISLAIKRVPRRPRASVQPRSSVAVHLLRASEWSGDVEHAVAQFQRQGGQWSRRRSAHNLRSMSQVIPGLVAGALENLSGLQPVGHPTLLMCANGGICDDTIGRRFLLGVAERGRVETHQHDHVEPRSIARDFLLRIKCPCQHDVLQAYVVGFQRRRAGVISSLDESIAGLGKLQSSRIHRFISAWGSRPQIAGCSDTACKHHATRNGPSRHRCSPRLPMRHNALPVPHGLVNKGNFAAILKPLFYQWVRLRLAWQVEVAREDRRKGRISVAKRSGLRAGVRSGP